MTAFQRIRKKTGKPRTAAPLVQIGAPVRWWPVPAGAGTKLERLFREDARCHWCARETVMARAHGGKLPKDAATIDHVYSRINPACKGKRHHVVLACYTCNQQRCRDEGIILFAKKLTNRERTLRLIAQSMVAA